MFKHSYLVGLALALPVTMGLLSGCGKLKEFTEEELAEAVANQMVSSYNAMSVEVSVTGNNGNTASFGISCAESGTLSWAEFEEAGEICYAASSNSCTYSVGNRSFTVDGEYEACGFPPSISTDGETATMEDLDGRTLYVTGSVTVSSANFSSSTCDYDLTVSNLQVDASGDEVSVSSSISGSLCGRREIDITRTLTVNGDFAVE